MKRCLSFAIALLLTLIASSAVAAEVASPVAQPKPKIYTATRFGAAPNDRAIDTEGIQKAIDECSGAGGGEVHISGGEFIAGNLLLKDGVTLVVEKGSVLRASMNRSDFKARCWIHAANSTNIGVRGPGKLVGNGSSFFHIELGRILSWIKKGAPTGGKLAQPNAAVEHPIKVDPLPFSYLIQFVRCRNVRVNELTIEDSPSWTVYMLACRDVTIRGVTIRNMIYGPYTDGIDINASSNVVVRDCHVTAGDDAFCIKSTSNSRLARPAKDIVFENCVARTPTNGFKIGTETYEDIQRVTFRGCRVESPFPGIFPLAGVNISTVDGGSLTDIVAENIVMDAVRSPVFIRLGNRGRGRAAGERRAGRLDGVTIRNVKIGMCSEPIIVAGLVDHPVKNVRFERVQIQHRVGLVSQRNVDRIPEHPALYPESTMFGSLPAWTFFCRHVDGLWFGDVRVPQRTDPGAPVAIFSDTVHVEGKIEEGKVVQN